jgi:hypothetical protein
VAVPLARVLLPRSWTKSCNGRAGETIASMAFLLDAKEIQKNGFFDIQETKPLCLLSISSYV